MSFGNISRYFITCKHEWMASTNVSISHQWTVAFQRGNCLRFSIQRPSSHRVAVVPTFSLPRTPLLLGSRGWGKGCTYQRPSLGQPLGQPHASPHLLDPTRKGMRNNWNYSSYRANKSVTDWQTDGLRHWRTDRLTKCNTSTPIFTKIVNWEQKWALQLPYS